MFFVRFSRCLSWTSHDFHGHGPFTDALRDCSAGRMRTRRRKRSSWRRRRSCRRCRTTSGGRAIARFLTVFAVKCDVLSLSGDDFDGFPLKMGGSWTSEGHLVVSETFREVAGLQMQLARARTCCFQASSCISSLFGPHINIYKL